VLPSKQLQVVDIIFEVGPSPLVVYWKFPYPLGVDIGGLNQSFTKRCGGLESWTVDMY
jgi:hypothetical protein